MYVDKSTGKMFVVGGIDEESHLEIMHSLHQLNTTKHKRILMHFSTLGGDDEQAFGIYDLIKNNPKPVDILVSGPCNSSGTLILQAASKRMAYANSTFLLHYGVPEYTCIQHTEFAKILDDNWINIIATRMKRPITYIDVIHRTETYWTALQALDFGLIDKIVTR